MAETAAHIVDHMLLRRARRAGFRQGRIVSKSGRSRGAGHSAAAILHIRGTEARPRSTLALSPRTHLESIAMS
jgi:hypothetical protein